MDDRPVDPDGEPKSRGTETTFDRDEWELEPLIEIVREQSDEVASELKSMGYMGRTVTVKVKYSDFQSITRSRTVVNPLDEAAPIAEIACALLREGTEAGTRAVRLVGVSMGGLVSPSEPLQLWLDLPLP